MKYSSIQIKNHITDFLKSHGILTLAVSQNDQPWACTLYYGLDDDLTMFLVSDPGSDHGQIIAHNQKVAFNVFDSHQPITRPKQGIRGKGTIQLVKGFKEKLKGLRLWHQANPGIEKNITIDDLKKIPDTKLYKLTPTYLKFFNKEIYGSAEYGILNLQKET